jgi:hypothetical protein
MGIKTVRTTLLVSNAGTPIILSPDHSKHGLLFASPGVISPRLCFACHARDTGCACFWFDFFFCYFKLRAHFLLGDRVHAEKVWFGETKFLSFILCAIFRCFEFPPPEEISRAGYVVSGRTALRWIYQHSDNVFCVCQRTSCAYAQALVFYSAQQRRIHLVSASAAGWQTTEHKQTPSRCILQRSRMTDRRIRISHS